MVLVAGGRKPNLFRNFPVQMSFEAILSRYKNTLSGLSEALLCLKSSRCWLIRPGFWLG